MAGAQSYRMVRDFFTQPAHLKRGGALNWLEITSCDDKRAFRHCLVVDMLATLNRQPRRDHGQPRTGGLSCRSSAATICIGDSTLRWSWASVAVI